MKKHRRGAFFIRSGHELSPGRSCHARPPGSIGLQGRKPPPTERCPGRMKPALRVADVCNPGRSRGAGEVFLQDQRMVPGRILRSRTRPARSAVPRYTCGGTPPTALQGRHGTMHAARGSGRSPWPTRHSGAPPCGCPAATIYRPAPGNRPPEPRVRKPA